MKIVNLTIELRDEEQIYHFEKMIKKEVKVVDFRILPDTKKLYDNDEQFRKILKGVKTAQKVRDKYINDHNF